MCYIHEEDIKSLFPSAALPPWITDVWLLLENVQQAQEMKELIRELKKTNSG